jgi:hypothetical protein
VRNTNSNLDAHKHACTECNTNCYPDGDTYCNPNANILAASYSHTEASPYSSAPPNSAWRDSDR